MTRSGADYWNRTWYGKSTWGWLWIPLSWLYAAVVVVRRLAWTRGPLRPRAAPAPVVVVGNLTVGGTGKTPVVIWLANALAKRGVRVAVVSRGYGGKPGPGPIAVEGSTATAIAGDEPVLIARRTTAQVVVHPDRLRAAATLDAASIDIILADDGLQHYRLQRDFEIAVVDGQRGFGNGRLLPAGPLREPMSRVRHVERVLVNGRRAAAWPQGYADLPAIAFDLAPRGFVSLADGRRCGTGAFAGQTVHAVAGIGNPERFFETLRSLDITVIPHPLQDHAPPDQLRADFGDELPIVMTEKDAVKYAETGAGNRWFLEIEAVVDSAGLVDEIAALVRRGHAS